MQHGMLPVAGGAGGVDSGRFGQRTHDVPEVGDGERLGQAGLVFVLQEIVGPLADHVAGHKDEALRRRRVFVADAFVKLLSVQSGHFPIAQGQVVLLLSKLLEGRGGSAAEEIDALLEQFLAAE